MSEFDPKAYLAQKKEEQQTTSDFDPKAYLAQAKSSVEGSAASNEPEEISKLDSFVGGAQQGLTFNSADELAGGIGVGLDYVQQNKDKLQKVAQVIPALAPLVAMIPDGPSPLQVDEKLKAEGFTGDLKDTLGLYKELRDSKRQDLAAQEAANPGTFLTGNIAGGLVSPATKVLAPAMSMKAPLQSIAKVAGAGAVGGAATGFGMSEGELLDMQAGDGGATQVLDDTLSGAQTGLMMAPTIGLGVEGLRKAPGVIKSGADLLRKIPIVDDTIEAAKGAFKGKEYSGNVQQYQDELREIGSNTVDMLKELSNKKFQVKTDALKKASERGDIISIEKSLDDMLEKIKILPEDTAEQVTAKTDVLNYIAKLRNGIKEIKPEQIVKQEPSLGDYTKIKFNRPEVEKNLEAQVAKLKSLGQTATGQIDEVSTPSGQKLLLPKIISEGGDQNPQIKSLAAKPAQTIKKDGTVIDNAPEMKKMLEQEVAKLKSLGQDVTAQIDEVTTESGEKLLVPRLISKGDMQDINLQALPPKEVITTKPAVNKLKRPDKVIPAEEIQVVAPETNVTPSRLEELIRRFRDLRPQTPATKEAQSIVDNGVKDLRRNLETSVPTLPKMNKESHDAQELFKRLTGVEPSDIKGGFDEAGTAEIKDRVTKILRNAPDSPTKLQDILKGFEGVKGVKEYAPDVGDYIEKRSTEAAKDLRLSELASGQVEQSEGIAKTLFGGFSGVAVKTGEMAGKAARSAVEPAKKMAADTTGYVKKLTARSPEGIQKLAQRSVEKFGAEGEKLARMLNEAAMKSPQARTAIIFGMMQRPEFREKLNELDQEDSSQESTPVGTDDQK